MIQLKSNITLFELSTLIGDVVAGYTHNYTFLDNPGVAYVSTHEAVAETEEEAVNFTETLSEMFTLYFGKKIKPFKYDGNNKTSEYSVFNSIFTAQSGMVRLLWLDNKIVSMLVGSKPLKIVFNEESQSPRYASRKQTPFKNQTEETTYCAHYFGFSGGSDADLALSDTDKEKLMTIPKTSWLVAEKFSNISQRHEDSCRSIAVSKNYVRWGSLEMFVGSNDINFLMYPKHNSYFFSKGGSYGSGIPGLVKILGDLDYIELLDTKLLEGDWNRYREYDNNFFVSNIGLIDELAKKKNYLKFSYNSMRDFSASKKALKGKDVIVKKYSVLTDEDTAKYKDNPRYNLIHSADGLLFYISKSDKLKATALQTKITKSLREEFISFLNWVGYFQLASDLEPGNMLDSFFPHMLLKIKEATWIEKAVAGFPAKKQELIELATEQYRMLYMGESTSTVTPVSNSSLLHTVFRDYSSGTRYSAAETDPSRLLVSHHQLFSFNKKFSLNISLADALTMVARGKTKENQSDSSRLYFRCSEAAMSFLLTNFILTDTIEKILENTFQHEPNTSSKDMQVMSNWSLKYNESIKEGQLLKTCITLSPEALAIFGSVATLSTPGDITTWLELSKDHFTKTLPKLLYDRYSSMGIASEEQLSAVIGLGIDYYMTIFSTAEPFSNKLLSPDDSSDEKEE